MSLLTKADLIDVTGKQRVTAQVRVLRDLGIDPFINGRGDIRLTWDIVNEAMRRRNGWETAEQPKRGPQPNLRAVK